MRNRRIQVTINILFVITIWFGLTACVKENSKPKVLDGIEYITKEQREETERRAKKDTMIRDIIGVYEKNNDIPLLQVIAEDIDSDERVEYVGVYGEPENIQALLIMNDEGAGVIPIEWKKSDSELIYESIELINMAESEGEYIYFSINNGEETSGIGIYQVNGKFLERLLYRVDKHNQYKYYLYDEEDDGYYDYSIAVRNIEDLQNHSIKIVENWNGERFEKADTIVTYENDVRKFMAPDNPIDAVKMYIDARDLASIVSMDDELDKLVYDQRVIINNPLDLLNNIENKEDAFKVPLSQLLEITPKVEDENRALIQIQYGDDALYTSMQNQGRWKILNIYKNYSNAYTSLYYYLVNDFVGENDNLYRLYLEKPKDINSYDPYENIRLVILKDDQEMEIFNLKNIAHDFSGVIDNNTKAYEKGYNEEGHLVLAFKGVKDEIAITMTLEIIDHEIILNFSE